MKGTERKIVKRIPYGISSFEGIREQHCYYVDKTAYIEQVEEANNFFFFIRPRRFGKSLLLSTLESYYDLNKKDKFQTLFGDLYIGQHPTPKRNSYLVLKLNFSTISSRNGDYRKSLDAVCLEPFIGFCNRYKHLLPEGSAQELEKRNSAIDQLGFLCRLCQEASQKIYLLIDEYDHFTNDILSNADRLKDYESETHGDSYFRQFFNAIKAGTDSAIEKCFITGVSPVTMDDLTSGFNIGTNYTNAPKFNGMVGFSEEEVRTLLDYYAEATGVFQHSTDELIRIMAPYYDHYCFAKDRFGKETMYNSNMVLYFLNAYIDNDGKLPNDMIDANIRTDYDKLRMLIRKDKEFDPDASTIQKIVNQGYITEEVSTHFPARDIANPRNFASLLYYFGFLTYGGTTEDDETKLIIPNQVVREQIYTFLLDIYQDMDLTQDDSTRRKLDIDLAKRGNWTAYFAYIADRLKACASVRDVQKGEAVVHGFMLGVISQNAYYYPYSEQDCNVGGYADILLSPRSAKRHITKHSYVIELKYVKPSEPDSAIEAALAQATAQVNRYAEAQHAAELTQGTDLHKLCIVFRGLKEMVCKEVI